MSVAATLAIPAMICYSMSPNAYITEHASEVKGLYDGFFYVCGSWDGGVAKAIGVGGDAPTDPDWLPMARANVEALNREGITENLLGAYFGQDEAWPSAETLLSDEFTAKINRHFAALGRAAKKNGFRGVSIDVEYPYKRCELDHEIYTYDGYTPGELVEAAYRQGRAVMTGVLDEFPDAVVFVLPGGIDARPLLRELMIGMLDVMAERAAPGGWHSATELAYTLWDPVTQVAIPVFEDGTLENLLSEQTLAYWKEQCTTAPGVWPLHMAERPTRDGYPQRPWSEELVELRQQMRILRTISERYIWSFSGHNVWHLPMEGGEAPGGRRSPEFPDAMTAVSGWHDILRDREPVDDVRLAPLFEAVRNYRAGDLDSEGLCNAFGTPASWWMLTYLGNPHKQPARAAPEAATQPVDMRRVYYGRGGAVRWSRHDIADPMGVVEMQEQLDHLHTDSASAHLTCWVHSDVEVDAVLNIGWDDGIVVRFGDEIVFDHPDYPPRGHGAAYRDRYLFEEHVPIRIPVGATRINMTTINSHGLWKFHFRITDANGYPIPGIRFLLSDGE